MKKTLSTNDMTGFIGWCIGAARFAPSTKPETIELMERLLPDEIAVHVRALMNEIPEDDVPCPQHGSVNCPDMVQYCASELVRYAHRVRTDEEFDAISDTEWALYRYYLTMVDHPAEDRFEHLKSFCKAIATSFVQERSKALLPDANPLSQITLAMQMSQGAEPIIAEVASALMERQFFPNAYYDKELAITTSASGTQITLIDKGDKPQVDEWPTLLDYGKGKIF